MIADPTHAAQPNPQAPAAPTANGPGGRTTDGRFATGNPVNRSVAALRRDLLDQATSADLDEALDALLLRAKGGDLAAIQVVLGYAIGQPVAAVDPDTLDPQECELHPQAVGPQAAMEGVFPALSSTTADPDSQTARPCAAGPRAADAEPAPAPAAALVPAAVAPHVARTISRGPERGVIMCGRPTVPAPSANRPNGGAALSPPGSRAGIAAGPGVRNLSRPPVPAVRASGASRLKRCLTGCAGPPPDDKRRHGPPRPSCRHSGGLC